MGMKSVADWSRIERDLDLIKQQRSPGEASHQVGGARAINQMGRERTSYLTPTSIHSQIISLSSSLRGCKAAAAAARPTILLTNSYRASQTYWVSQISRRRRRRCRQSKTSKRVINHGESVPVSVTLSEVPVAQELHEFILCTVERIATEASSVSPKRTFKQAVSHRVHSEVH